MNNKIMKYENPKRLTELNPSNTLERIGVNKSSVVFDYGAGTGIFSIPAAQITHNNVYAYDINKDVLEVIKQKISEQNINNLDLVDTENVEETINNISADFILLVTVYHEIKDKENLFNHFEKLLSENGKIIIIEFKYKDTPMGPPIGHRVKRETLIDEFDGHQYKLDEEFELGDNFWLISFLRK